MLFSKDHRLTSSPGEGTPGWLALQLHGRAEVFGRQNTSL